MKIRESLVYPLTTIIVAATVATFVGCGGSSSSNNNDAETGREATCMSNLKQLGLAMEFYVQDYDEALPQPVHGAPEAWSGHLSPYLHILHDSYGDFDCPDDSTGPGGILTPQSFIVSYALNSNCQDSNNNGGTVGDAISLAEIPVPAQSVEFFEVAGDRSQVTLWDEGTSNYTKAPPAQFVSAAGDGLTTGPEWGYLGAGANPLTYATGPMGGRKNITTTGRHSGGANYTALDGHAVYLPPSKVSSGTNNPSLTGAQDTPVGAAAGVNATGYTLTFSTH
jgi:prepilin-type processing-associated H-X9-DG protein